VTPKGKKKKTQKIGLAETGDGRVKKTGAKSEGGARALAKKQLEKR